MYANKLQEKFILNANKQKAEKEKKKKAVSKQKATSKKTTLQEPFTNEALINRQKAKYDEAQEEKGLDGFIGKRIANTEANKVREAAKMPLYSSAVGDKQALKTFSKTATAAKRNTAIQMAVNNETKQQNTVLGQMFDKKENYIDKAKKGNIKGATLNFVGSGVQGAQSLYMNTLNNADSLVSGKGLAPFKHNMDYTDYESSVAKRHGDKTITQRLTEKNKTLGAAYNMGMNIATDPLNLLDGAAVLKAKGLKNLGSTQYADDLLKGNRAFTPVTLKSGKTVETIEQLESLPPVEKAEAMTEIQRITGYHGTKQAGFEKFKTDKPIWFADSPEMAEVYAGKAEGQVDATRIASEGDNPGMYKSYLEIKNPFVLDREITEFPTYAEASKTLGIRPGTLMGFKKKYLDKAVPSNEIKLMGDGLRKNGVGINSDGYYDTNTGEQFFKETGDIFDNTYSAGKQPTELQNKLIQEHRSAVESKGERAKKIERYRKAMNEDRMVQPLYSIINTPEYKQKLQLKGYDGIVAIDQGEKTYSVFDNSQIKNAIGYTPQKQYDNLLKEFQANFKNLTDEQKMAYQAKFEELRPSKATQLPQASVKAQNNAIWQTLPINQTSTPKANETPLNANLNGQKSAVNKLPNKLGNLYEKTVDSQYTIGKAVKGVEQSADKNAKILASNARNARGTVDYSIKNGLVDMEGKQVAKTPLQTVFESTPNLKDFNEYLLHKHNVDRFREGKPIFGHNVTSENSAEIVKRFEKQYPQFKEFSGAVNENSNKIIDEWLVKGGLISKELGEKLKLKYKNYVPTYREGTVKGENYNAKGLKANTVVKTAVGSEKPVIPPNISIGIQMNQAIKAVRKNEIYQGLLDAVRKNPEKMANYAKLADDTADVKYQNTIIKNAVDNIDLDDIESVANGQLGIDKLNGKFYVTAMENGKPVRMEVAKELFDSLQSLDKLPEGVMDKFAQGFRKYATNPFKALITGYNPFFALRNIARDIPTSYIQGTENNPLKWGKNLIDAGASMAKNDASYKEFKALGGKQSGYFNAEKGITSENLPTKALKKLGQGISAFNEATETLPRFGEYKGTLKREGTDYAAKQQGIYNAGEATVNFARNGEYTKAADSFIPYLNPAVQGIDKSIRTFSKPQNVAKAIGMVSVPSAAIYALNHKTEEDAKNYDMLDNRTKDTYFVFPTGGGEFIKIPKSREAGVLFSSLPERILRAYQGDEKAFKGFGNTIATNFAPQNPVEDNILAPATLNLAKNKDFANRAIVPINMLNDKRSKYLQYDETTSELTKWLGEEFHKIGLEKFSSPKQLEYIIDSYSGIIGDILLPATTKGENPIENVMTKPFTADTVYNNELQNMFYEDFDKATREKTDLNLTQDIPTEWVTPEEKKVSSFNKTSLAMGDIRKDINKQRANGASKEELRGLRNQLNDLAMSGSKTAEQKYQEYLKTYIPEISGMSDKQKQGYAEYAEPQGISAADFNSANTQSKEYRTNLSKISTILNAYPENGETIALGLGYSKGSIQNAKLFAKKGIEPTYYERYRQIADTNQNGKITAKEAHDILKNEDLTASQRAYLIRILQGSALKPKE